MNYNPKDMALDALLVASHEVSPDLSIDLLSAVYQIEKTNQFNQERDVLSTIQKLIDNEILTNKWSGE